ncbi:hypothetical protein [Actinoplanes sp. NPDC049681]|uniref:hypothetical protein n=1 Tax=Actinoplanes sp. NPDC049681 TaxID=3363905 RepID=UPI0037A253CC
MSQPPYPGPQYPQQPSGQPYQQPGPGYGQPIPGQPQPGSPFPGQPNPDVPPSVPPGYPPQPAYGPASGQPAYGPTSGQPAYGPTSGQPAYGQVPGQPEYTQVDYGQPGYPQTGYPQADYGQPGYPQSGPPMAAGYPPAPKPKSRALPITLVSIAVFLVLCVGGGTAVYLVGRNAVDDSKTVSPTLAPTVTAEPTDATDEPTAEPAAEITVVEPATLGGRRKLTDPQFAGAVKQLEEGLDKVPGATGTVGSLYGSPSQQNIVIVAAAAAEVDDPVRELDGTFLGAGVGGLKITGITSTAPGALGGVAKCGRGEAGGAPLIMCGWADEGSVGWMIFYYKSMSGAKAEFPKLRGQVEKKSN